jgi:hypothetical protein
MVQELNGFDNFFFEIQNEPWADHPVSILNIENKEALPDQDWRFNALFAEESVVAWQKKIASFIVDEEQNLDKKHLIAQNYTNYKTPVPKVEENISIINFHYNWPESVKWNYGYNKVIGFDESGFAGSGDKVYRRQAWRFILSGGGLFNNLDYSFFSGYEDGTMENDAPGGGSVNLRKQLKILSDFIHSFNVVKLKPDHTSVLHAPGLIPYIMSDPGKEYAIFLQSITESTVIKLDIPAEKYIARHINTISGETIREEEIQVGDDPVEINVAIPDGELALDIRKVE